MLTKLLSKLVHKALSYILQIVASMVTVSAQCALYSMLEAIAKFDDVGNCLYMFVTFYPLVL